MKQRTKLSYITRKLHFNAAHKLYNEDWSEEKNQSVFGKCANRNWHGHNFDLYVTVKGTPDPDTGFVIDLKKLKEIVEEYAVDLMDHRNLNIDVPFMRGLMPSIENISVAVWEQIEPHLPDNCQLHCIKLYETENQFVEYYGD